MEGRPGQVRSTSSFRLILHDPRSIHYIQERFLQRYRPLAASAVFAFLALPPRAVAIRSRVLEIFGLGSCSPFELEHCTGCNQPQLSASSSRVIPEHGSPSQLGATSCGNCGNLPHRASSRVQFHKTFDCLVSSSSRTFLPSRDRFSRLFPLPGRRAVLQGWRNGHSPIKYD